jgi:hypothetical protein
VYRSHASVSAAAARYFARKNASTMTYKSVSEARTVGGGGSERITKFPRAFYSFVQTTISIALFVENVVPCKGIFH